MIMSNKIQTRKYLSMIINQCGGDMYVVLRKDSGLWHTQCEDTDLEYWRYLWLFINEVVVKMCG